jgi:hypothetical protein
VSPKIPPISTRTDFFRSLLGKSQTNEEEDEEEDGGEEDDDGGEGCSE